MDLKNSAALVTGGASGLGAATAQALADAGANVAILDVNGDAAGRMAEQIGGLGLAAMGFFLLILVVGFVYEWKKGALEWD